MSAKRRLRRQQGKSAAPSKPDGKSGPSRSSVRKQTEAERFKTPGSETLWPTLCGLSPVERDRAWLVQAIHDETRRRESGHPDPAAAIHQLSARAPGVAEQLDETTVETASELWLASGDDYTPGDPAPKWEYLANLCHRLDLGTPSADDLQEQWETFTGLLLASAPRRALMDSLAASEQAALELDAVTRSDNVKAIANVVRILWTALAYADEDTFERLQRFSNDWLARQRGEN